MYLSGIPIYEFYGLNSVFLSKALQHSNSRTATPYGLHGSKFNDQYLVCNCNWTFI